MAAAPRPWGYWTEGKLDMLASYLHGFTTAGQRVPRLYLDLFAGQLENTRRDTGRPVDGSLIRALTADPPLTAVRAFELRRDRAESLERECRARFPDRDVHVFPGDVHEQLRPALASLRGFRTCPTFAFVDPDGVEARWSLLETLADFKHPPRGRPYSERNKIELFILMSSPAIPRVVHDHLDPEARGHAERTITELFGSDAWRPITTARRERRLDPEQTRDELTNLLRWRLEQVLGYRHTHTLRVHNVGGGPVYDLVFATDHNVGDKIMRHVYTSALTRFPQMQVEAQAYRADRREEEKGTVGLFSHVELAQTGGFERPVAAYKHEAPVPPFGER